MKQRTGPAYRNVDVSLRQGKDAAAHASNTEFRKAMAKVQPRQFIDHSCEVKPPFSFRKRSATPDFGLSEDSTHGDTPTPARNPPALPIDRVTDYQETSGLSSIHTSLDSPKPLPQEESRDIIGLLQAAGAGENSVRLSPVIQQKTYSRLDESSIVDPSTQLIIDPSSDSRNRQLQSEVSRLIASLVEQREAFKAVLQSQSSAFDRRLAEIQYALTAQQRQQDDTLSRLKTELRRRSPAEKENSEVIIGEYQKGLQEREKSQKAAANQKLAAVKEEYEARLRQQQDQLRTVRQQNAQLRARIDDAVARAALPHTPASLCEEMQMQSLADENESLRQELCQIKRSLACPRCCSASRARRNQ